MDSKVCHAVTSLRQEYVDFVQIWYSENGFVECTYVTSPFGSKAEIVFREKDHDYG